MTAYTQDMPQTATYWAPSGLSSTGDPGYATPVSINCRWQAKRELIRDAQGRQTASKAVVYPDQPVAVGGWLHLGDQTAEADPRGLAGGFEIISVGDSPDLDNVDVLNKAWL